MMYIHFCKNCSRLHMLNGHKMKCPACGDSLFEMKMPYMDYVNMTATQRKQLLDDCHNEEYLQKLSTTYRMYKYSKWYRNQMTIQTTTG